MKNTAESSTVFQKGYICSKEKKYGFNHIEHYRNNGKANYHKGSSMIRGVIGA